MADFADIGRRYIEDELCTVSSDLTEARAALTSNNPATRPRWVECAKKAYTRLRDLLDLANDKEGGAK